MLDEHLFDMKTYEFNLLQTSGKIPHPVNVPCITIYKDLIYIYGGRGDNERKNDLYTFNKDTCKYKYLDFNNNYN